MLKRFFFCEPGTHLYIFLFIMFFFLKKTQGLCYTSRYMDSLEVDSNLSALWE